MCTDINNVSEIKFYSKPTIFPDAVVSHVENNNFVMNFYLNTLKGDKVALCGFWTRKTCSIKNSITLSADYITPINKDNESLDPDYMRVAVQPRRLFEAAPRGRRGNNLPIVPTKTHNPATATIWLLLIDSVIGNPGRRYVNKSWLVTLRTMCLRK